MLVSFWKHCTEEYEGKKCRIFVRPILADHASKPHGGIQNIFNVGIGILRFILCFRPKRWQSVDARQIGRKTGAQRWYQIWYHSWIPVNYDLYPSRETSHWRLVSNTRHLSIVIRESSLAEMIWESYPVRDSNPGPHESNSWLPVCSSHQASAPGWGLTTWCLQPSEPGRPPELWRPIRGLCSQNPATAHYQPWHDGTLAGRRTCQRWRHWLQCDRSRKGRAPQWEPRALWWVELLQSTMMGQK